MSTTTACGARSRNDRRHRLDEPDLQAVVAVGKDTVSYRRGIADEGSEAHVFPFATGATPMVCAWVGALGDVGFSSHRPGRPRASYALWKNPTGGPTQLLPARAKQISDSDTASCSIRCSPGSSSSPQTTASWSMRWHGPRRVLNSPVPKTPKSAGSSWPDRRSCQASPADRRSTPPWTPSSPAPSSSRRSPKADCAHASPCGSHGSQPLIASRCLRSAATAQRSPDEHDPRGSVKSARNLPPPLDGSN